jgi:hypothetical protein
VVKVADNGVRYFLFEALVRGWPMPEAHGKVGLVSKLAGKCFNY